MSAVSKKSMNNSDPVIAWIEKKRADGLSMSQIAEQLGVRCPTVYDWVRNGRASYAIEARIHKIEARQSPGQTKLEDRCLRIVGKVVKKAYGYAALALSSFLYKVAKHYWEEKLGK